MDIVSAKVVSLMNSQVAPVVQNIPTAASDDSFQNIMNQNMKNDEVAKPEEVTKDSENAGKEIKDTCYKKNPVKGTEDAEKVQEANPEEVMTEEQITADIKEVLKQQLGLTDEELEEIMSQLGLQYTDLLNPDNMKMLFMEVHKLTDASEILMDENLYQEFTTLVDSMKELEDKVSVMTQIENDVNLENVSEQVMVPIENTGKVNLKDEKNITLDTEDEQTVQETKQTPDIVVEKEDGMSKEFSSDRFKESSSQSEQDPMETFVQNLTGSKAEFKADMVRVTQNVEVMREIVNQVVEQIKIAIRPESTSMELQLNPESLGKVNLSVVAKDGVLTATFAAQNEMARVALESQVQILRDNLDAQGLKVEAIEVTVAEFGFEQQNQEGNGQQAGKGKKSERRILDIGKMDDIQEELTEEENLAVEVMKQNGGSVDYTV